MSYTIYTDRELKENFGIVPEQRQRLFAGVAPRAVSDWLLESIHRNRRMALAQVFEKPRSEFLVAPVLTEFYAQAEKQISLFSGCEFNVDDTLNLFGHTDFLISRSTNQFDLEAPIIIAVKVKQDDLVQGATQCFAEVVAARIFNQRENTSTPSIYGCVTTGDAWRFLMLNETEALVDPTIFDVTENIEQILGILWAMSFDEIISETRPK